MGRPWSQSPSTPVGDVAGGGASSLVIVSWRAGSSDPDGPAVIDGARRLAALQAFLEVWRPSGREMVELGGVRLRIGKNAANDLVLDHDPTVSRLHAVVENHGSAWSIRDLGSRNGTLVNGEPLLAERVLRPGDEVRVGDTRLVFVQPVFAGEQTTTRPVAPRPRLTPRETDVLRELCRPLASGDPFPQPASIRVIAQVLVVTEAAVKQHLLRLYDKFEIYESPHRRVELAREALRRGVVNLAELRHP